MTKDGTRRGQRVYDRWADAGPAYVVVDRLTRGLRHEAIDELEIGAGDTVVDLGCGPGDSLPLLADTVGPAGDVVGVDYSEAMVTAAADRVATVSAAAVLRGDAAQLPVETDAVNGVLASLALSAMPQLEAVLDEVARVLRPGGRLVVVDGRVPDGAFGALIQRLYHRLVNFQNTNVLGALRQRFPTVRVAKRFDAGIGFIAVAEVN